MAGWISSKLKVAETLLQQIDQQAAESLGKTDRPISTDPLGGDDTVVKNQTPPVSSEQIPVKLQLNKKKPSELTPRPDSHRKTDDERPDRDQIRQSKDPDSVTADGDWTELLRSEPSPSGAAAGVSFARQKSVKKRGIPFLGEAKRKSDVIVGDVKSRKTISTWKTPASEVSGRERDPDAVSDVVGLVNDSADGSTVEIVRVDDVAIKEGVATGVVLEDGTGNAGATNMKREGGTEIQKVEGRYGSGAVVGSSAWSTTTVGSSAPHGSSRSPTESSRGSDSESDSGSSSDSEVERERREERRRRMDLINAEKASEVIKECENVVAKLEGEKQSLEKILEERKKQQAHEASELQTSMMETMEAVELEKQKHNSTRMEALARLAALESTNAELARSLATTQWNLEVEANNVAEIREDIELKKCAQEELRRKLSKFHQSGSSLNKLENSNGAEYEEGMLQAEHSFLCDKIGFLKEKVKKLEESIEVTRKEVMEPTEVEVELNGRLEQLTDHLIQKQTQVEALSSEKAMLLFRIETVLKFLDDNGLSSRLAYFTVDSAMESAVGPSVRVDIEGDSWEPLNPMSETPFPKIRMAKHHIGSFLRQLDSIFSAGAIFLRRNTVAQLWSLVYLLCLHLWVIYVLSSRSDSSNGARSGAVISLENINKTTRF